MAIDAHVDQLSCCRVCSAHNLTKFLTLPNMPITGAFLKSPDEAEFLYPLDLYVCESCGMVQSQHNVSFRSYYEDYAYTIAASGYAMRFAQSLAEEVARKWNIPAGGRILEIGSGDGSQLACFKAMGMEVQGFEPSSILAKVANDAGIPTVCDLFSSESVDDLSDPDRKFDLILLTHVLDHLPSQEDFFKAVHKLLSPERGLLLIETHNFEETFEFKEYCLFQHEHTIYPTAASLQRMFDREGLDLIDTGILPADIKRAHSLMVLGTPKGSVHSAAKMDMLPLGPRADPAALRVFAAEVEATIARVRAHILDVHERGGTLAGFGAGGRGIMTLAAAARPGELAYICDSSPAHHGAYTPAAHVEIVPPETIAERPVSELLVFSYGYIDEIRKQLQDYGVGDLKVVSLLDILEAGESKSRPELAPA